ncbi:MAG TPA: EcsC family protein, partial [Anaeromyxobacteraceae bacterium]|nr:EcsC family protein [Anaeromyxobacteraceae bacterium]
MPLSPAEEAELAQAKRILENPSVAIRMADVVGRPIDGLVRRLPEEAQRAIAEGTQRALQSALRVAVQSLDRQTGAPADWLHRAAVITSGAVGGMAGLPGLVLELPFSLTVMLRAIADHARAKGEDLSRVQARLECLAVFAYGSRAASDDAADSAYFATRAGFAQVVSHAAEYVARAGAAAVGEGSAPALVQLVARIAQRFGVTVTQKAAAQMVPVIGAAGGAAINALFMTHYQDTARAHFTVRRLERAHGAD